MESNADDEKIKTGGKDRPPRRGPRPPKKVTAQWLHNCGLHYLQRFAASTSHFRAVMVRKIDKSCRHHTGQNRDECLRMLDDMIAGFVRSGLLDDKSFAAGSVHSLHRRGLSRQAMTGRLQAKGLSAEAIVEAIDHYNEENNHSSARDGDFAAALNLARRRRIGPFAAPGKDIDRDKAVAAFARAGFGYDIARKIVDMGPDDLNDQD